MMHKNLLLLVAAIGVAGCSPTLNDNSSAVTLHAAFGEGPGEDGTVGFYSDVVTDSGESLDESYDIFVDSVLKNPNAEDISPLYTVDYTSYTVVYTRPDGRNEPGVDVPFPFTMAIGGSIEAGGTSQLKIPIVTQEMKRAAPLRNLYFTINQRIYTTVTVTIYGRDRASNNVVTSPAVAPVIFGDY